MLSNGDDGVRRAPTRGRARKRAISGVRAPTEAHHSSPNNVLITHEESLCAVSRDSKARRHTSSPDYHAKRASLSAQTQSRDRPASSSSETMDSDDDEAQHGSSPTLHANSPIEIGLCFAALDEKQPAVVKLRKAFVEQDNMIIYLREALRREQQKKRACSSSCAKRDADLKALLVANERILRTLRPPRTSPNASNHPQRDSAALVNGF
ncbi:hypothetical protein BD626DRAFT_576194 [Schizophyllum amplum]|uniref:Uncharacterized protein n=1 Tax=Schizophyllum amplum TaxID=97359 RepID=A0A550BU01_9AGAR|nr:hypothetical protein BD626DRAFT_576194 [Auriculariopsis ampla]